MAGAGLWQFTPIGGEDGGGGETTTPRIAVLPFENIAPDSSEDYFARGIHEEVLNQLSNVSGLKVISRTSVLRYADTDKSVPQISEELGGVNALLEGTVRRAADQVRITTQLIAAPEDEHLWSNTYDRELSVDAIFEIQADIAGQIASALETELTEGERQRIESPPTDDLAAYDAYLKGRNAISQYWATIDQAHIDRAIGHLRDAIRRDSSFAEAHAWLGVAYSLGPGRSRIDSAAASVKRAKAIDSDLAAVHLARSYVYERRGATSARIEALRRAVELQPSHGFATAILSDALETGGRYAEAVRVAHKAVRLSPRRPIVLQEMADQLRAVGLYDASAAWDRQVLEIEPGHLESVQGLTWTLRLQGQPERALQTWERFIEERLPDPASLVLAADAALRAGHPERAKAYIERISAAHQRTRSEETPSRSEDTGWRIWERGHLGLAELRLGNQERGRELLTAAVDSFRAEFERPDEDVGSRVHVEVAKFYAALGETERALRLLEQAIAGTEDNGFEGSGKQELLTSSFFDNLRSEPRFQKIVEQVQAERRKAREEVLQMGLDLYPPGTEADSAQQAKAPSS